MISTSKTIIPTAPSSVHTSRRGGLPHVQAKKPLTTSGTRDISQYQETAAALLKKGAAGKAVRHFIEEYRNSPDSCDLLLAFSGILHVKSNYGVVELLIDALWCDPKIAIDFFKDPDNFSKLEIVRGPSLERLGRILGFYFYYSNNRELEHMLEKCGELERAREELFLFAPTPIDAGGPYSSPNDWNATWQKYFSSLLNSDLKSETGDRSITTITRAMENEYYFQCCGNSFD